MTQRQPAQTAAGPQEPVLKCHIVQKKAVRLRYTAGVVRRISIVPNFVVGSTFGSVSFAIPSIVLMPQAMYVSLISSETDVELEQRARDAEYNEKMKTALTVMIKFIVTYIIIDAILYLIRGKLPNPYSTFGVPFGSLVGMWFYHTFCLNRAYIDSRKRDLLFEDYPILPLLGQT